MMPDVQRVETAFSYSAAVVAGDTVYLGLHRGFGDTFADQLRDIFDAMAATLGGLGLTTASLVKVTVWLKTISDLPQMETLFNDYFARGQFPARMTATTEFIDADCLAMIEGIAYRAS